MFTAPNAAITTTNDNPFRLEPASVSTSRARHHPLLLISGTSRTPIFPLVSPDFYRYRRAKTYDCATERGQANRYNYLKLMSSFVMNLLAGLPKGDALDEPAWNSRHRGILSFSGSTCWEFRCSAPTWGRAPASPSEEEGSLPSSPSPHGFLSSAVELQSAIATCGLMTASALLVHLSGGQIELHFHFFVMMSVIVLYQDWLPFLVGLQFIILDHGVVGTLMPDMVYGHAEGQTHPWTWALIHGGFHPGRMCGPALLLAGQ